MTSIEFEDKSLKVYFHEKFQKIKNFFRKLLNLKINLRTRRKIKIQIESFNDYYNIISIIKICEK